MRLSSAHQTHGGARGSTNAVVCGEPSRPVIATLPDSHGRWPGLRAAAFPTATAIVKDADNSGTAELVGEFGVGPAPPRQLVGALPHQSSARKPPDLQAAPAI